MKVFPSDLSDQLDKLLVHEILLFCSCLVHFISKSDLADHFPEHSQHFNIRWMTITLLYCSYHNKTDPLLQAKQHFLNQSINQRHLFLLCSSCAPQVAQESHQGTLHSPSLSALAVEMKAVQRQDDTAYPKRAACPAPGIPPGPHSRASGRVWILAS